MELLKKLFGWIASLMSILLVLFFGLNTFLAWKANKIRQEKLEFLGTSEEERAAAKKRKEEQEENLRNAQLENLASPEWGDKGKVLDPQKMDEPLGIKDLSTVGPGKLIYSDKVKKFFTAILEDLEDLVGCGKVYEEKDDEQDNYSNKFVRRNAIFYGAPGTGKSEFPRQLVYEIAAKFSSEAQKRQQEYNQDLAELQKKLEKEALKEEETEEKKVEQEQNVKNLQQEIKQLQALITDCEQEISQEDNKLVPVFQVDGFHLQTAGKALNDKGLESHEKLIEILKSLKKEYFGDAYSDKPYIVFVEEADQGVNVMTAGSGGKKANLLEDWKNFLSTTEDAAGLKGKVQDPNSCIIIATNNYKNLDQALVRRGRLGKKLNFSWTPELLKEYGEAGNGTNWTHIDWPNDPAWDFTNSKHREELYKMTTKMGYAMFVKEFAPHAPKIINSWRNLPANKKKNKEAELKTFKDENKKDVCYWLLHYLFTFFQFYEEKNNVEAFQGAEQIQRYDFGAAARMEENTISIATTISSAIVNLNQGITNKLAEIRAEMVANFQEISNLRNEINQFRQNIQAIDKDIDTVRHEFQRLSDSVNHQLSNIGNQISSSISSQLGSLQSQINSINSKLSGMSSGGGGSSSSGGSSGGGLSDRQAVINKVDEIINYLNANRGNIDGDRLINLVEELLRCV